MRQCAHPGALTRGERLCCNIVFSWLISSGTCSRSTVRIDNPAPEQRFTLPRGFQGATCCASSHACRGRRGRERQGEAAGREGRRRHVASSWRSRVARSDRRDLRARPIRSWRVRSIGGAVTSTGHACFSARGPRPRTHRGDDRAAVEPDPLRRLALRDGDGAHRGDRRRLWSVPARPTTTSCSIIPSRSATSSRWSSSAAGMPHHLVSPAGSNPISSAWRRTSSRSAQRRSISLGGRRRSTATGSCVSRRREGWGGLEHRASTSLIFGRDDLPKPGEPGGRATISGFSRWQATSTSTRGM